MCVLDIRPVGEVFEIYDLILVSGMVIDVVDEDGWMVYTLT